MNKKTGEVILLIWIGITSLLDLGISMFFYPIIVYVNHANDGAPFYEDNAYAIPIHELVLNQIVVSLLLLLFGVVWSAIVLMSSERLLVFLKFPTPQNNKFSHFSLGVFKFALLTIGLAIVIGNVSLIHDQIQGRAAFERK